MKSQRCTLHVSLRPDREALEEARDMGVPPWDAGIYAFDAAWQALLARAGIDPALVQSASFAPEESDDSERMRGWGGGRIRLAEQVEAEEAASLAARLLVAGAERAYLIEEA